MKIGQSTEVRFLGQKITIRTQESDPELIKQVVDLVSARLSEVEKKTGSVAPHQVALLALMNLAEEYIQAKSRTVEFKGRLNQKITGILQVLEAGSL